MPRLADTRPSTPRVALTGIPAVTLAYLVIAVAMTWPLAMRLGTSIAADLGDPAFNSWVLAWDMAQFSRLLHGDLGALRDYWNANIFAPQPLTLAYSEHLTAQAVQTWPVYAATGNLLVAYNVLFISTFVVAALGAYVLVRELTSRPLAAFLAGLAYAYVPYRMGQLSHVQILSSGWMPLALFGFHRYFAALSAASSRRALSGLAVAVGATVVQNLSCGYYMLFFAPFAGACVLYEIARRRLWRMWRMWGHLVLAAAAIGLLTWPFVAPYFELRALTGMGVRPMSELAMYSADAHAFVTAPGTLHLYAGWLTGYVKAEGEGFLGFVIMAFAAMGVAWGLRRSLATIPWKRLPDWLAITMIVSGAVATLAAGLLLWFFVHGNLTLLLDGRRITYQSAGDVFATMVGAFVLCLVLAAVGRARQAPHAEPTAFAFYAIAAVSAALLAMGPQMRALGRSVGTGPYYLLYAYVPGFDGLRVPARLLMLVALFMAVLAGVGAAALLATRFRRAAMAFVVLGMAGILAEGWGVPLIMNRSLPHGPGLVTAPRLEAGRQVDAIYGVVKALPDPVVLIEFPFGDTAYELQAVFYAGHHLRPLVNGYSGFFPAAYSEKVPVLRNAPDNPGAVLSAMGESGATHALVHERAFLEGRGTALSEWLTSIGARLVAEDNGSRLFALPGASGPKTGTR